MRKMMITLTAVSLLALCACQENLYSKLDEKDATAMMATLMEQGVSCGKLRAKEGWELSVDKGDLPAAVRILEREGYPHYEYKDVGQIFGSKGLISSPQEDRIRYIYALSQEIAETISQIDGVLTSRVHLVLPENDPLSATLKPASASVFVKYLPSSQVPRNVSQIKQLVLTGVEGLSMDNVSVVAVPGTKVEPVSTPAMSLAGLQLYKNSLIPLIGLAGFISALLLGGGYIAGIYFRKGRAAPKPGKPKETAAELAKL
jgi:type III secretion protein J